MRVFGLAIKKQRLQGLGLLVILLILVRSALLMIDPRPLFTADSYTYLLNSRASYLPYDRPAGTGFLYRQALSVHFDLLSLLVAQATLGVGTALLAYVLARQVGLGRGQGVVAGLVVGLAPSTLLFEKTIHSETAGAFLTVLVLALLLAAVARSSVAIWFPVGVLGALAVLVRSASVALAMASAAAILLAWRQQWSRRAVGLLVLLVGVALPLVPYASAMADQTREDFGMPRPGITFFDGVSLFGLTASRTDCTPADRPPPIREEVCAVPGFLDQPAYRIIWHPGPVQQELRTRSIPDVNSELRSLALETIGRNPVWYLRSSVGRLGGLFRPTDPVYSASPARVGVDEILRGYFADAQRWPPRDYLSLWNPVLTAWHVVRWSLWIALGVGALLAIRSGELPLLVLAGFCLLSVAVTVAITYTSPRLMFPLEAPAVVVSLWALSRLWRKRSRRVFRLGDWVRSDTEEMETRELGYRD